VVVVGTVIPVSSLSGLRFTHSGADINSASPITVSFGVTVSDGGGGATSGTVNISIAAVNTAPTVSGSPTLIEGQVKAVAPTINLGDAFDTLANATIVIDDVVTGTQGTFFIDANGNNSVDADEALTGTTTLNESQRTNLSTQLKFLHNGAEPNAPSGVSAPSYRISVIDAGGRAGGTPSAAVVTTITLAVTPNNDDPTLTNLHATSGAALSVTERSTTVITNTMLRIDDADRNPANLNTTTPTAQLVYTIETRPTGGELQLNVAGTWVILGAGGRFTQADVDASRLRYVQTTEVLATPTGAITSQTFHLSITPVAGNEGIGAGSAPGAPTPGHGQLTPGQVVYSFEATAGMLSNNSTANGSWMEGNSGATHGGYVITSTMLS